MRHQNKKSAKPGAAGALKAARAARPDRQIILVLGMHRSGTSALGRVVNLLGAASPKNLLFYTPHNARGHWESTSILEFHTSFLHALDSQWDDWRSIDPARQNDSAARPFKDELKIILGSEYGDAPLYFVKDPRICRLMPFWLTVLQELNVEPLAVISLRNPLEVAMSLQRRDGFSSFKSLILWLRHVLEAEYYSRQLPRIFVRYDLMLADWRKHLLPGIKQIDAAWPDLTRAAELEIDDFLSPDLRHETAELSELSAHPKAISWVVETNDILLKLCDDDKNPRLLARIDAVRAAFDAACRAFGDVFRTKEIAAEQSRAALQVKTVQIQALQTESARLSAELERLQAVLAESHAELELRGAEGERLQAELELRGVECKRFEVEMARQTKEIVRLKEELSQHSAQIDAIFRSRSWRITSPLRSMEKRLSQRKKK